MNKVNERYVHVFSQSINQSIDQSTNQAINHQAINQSIINQSVNQSSINHVIGGRGRRRIRRVSSVRECLQYGESATLILFNLCPARCSYR